MKKILFRGYNKEIAGDHFIYSETVLYQEHRRQWLMLVNNELGEQWVEIDEPQPYTGYDDRNGKKIFEGDKLQWIEGGIPNKIPHYVLFDPHLRCFVLAPNKELMYTKSIVCPDWYEIIGNIYDEE